VLYFESATSQILVNLIFRLTAEHAGTPICPLPIPVSGGKNIITFNALVVSTVITGVQEHCSAVGRDANISCIYWDGSNHGLG
jgi:hypothetical protein